MRGQRGRKNMTLRPEIETGIRNQAEHVSKNGAPGTGAICQAMIQLAKGPTLCGQRIANWPDDVIESAMPLRLAGGLHDLFRRGLADELGAVYRGELIEQGAIDAVVSSVVARHDAALLPWFDGPPQTNEAGRSASFVAALHWLSGHVLPRFELNEIGSSAGMNLLIDRYGYDLCGVTSGPEDAPVIIQPEWNGAAPPANAISIAAVHGSDIAPIDVRDESAANRLMAFIWPEMPARFTRMTAGIKMIRDRPVDLVRADAADFVDARLSAPQSEGVTRVLMHSIVWQYLPKTSQMRIAAAMERAGAAATPEKPLAWIALETNRATFRHELKVRFWPGSGESHLLGEAHAHGVWMNWHGG
jgi:hypothetical protein